MDLPILIAQAGGPKLDQLLLMMGAMFAIMWFLVINPQRKQMRQHRDLLGSLKKGDDVVTQGGILGKVYAIDDKIVTVEVANGVRLRVLKSSISGKSAVAEDAAKPAEPAKKEEK